MGFNHYSTRNLLQWLYNTRVPQLVGSINLLPTRLSRFKALPSRNIRTKYYGVYSDNLKTKTRILFSGNTNKLGAQCFRMATAAVDNVKENKFGGNSTQYYDILENLQDQDYFYKILRKRSNSQRDLSLFRILKSVGFLNDSFKDSSLLLAYSKCMQNFTFSTIESLTDEDKRELSRCFNRILFFISRMCGKNEANSLFQFMKLYDLSSAATYDLMVRIYCSDSSCFPKDALQVVEDMISVGLKPSTRTYFPFLITYIKRGDQVNATDQLRLIKKMESNFHDENHGLLLSTIADIEDFVFFHKMLSETLEYHRETAYIYGKFSKEALKQVFSRSDFGEWDLKEAKVDERVTCLSCGTQLQPVKLSEKDITRMNEGLGWFLKMRLAEDIPQKDFTDFTSLARYYRDIGEIIKDKRKLNSKVKDHRLVTLKRLKYFLERNGPYDVIVDMQNLGYSGQKGFNAARVEVVVRELLEKGKKVVGFCAGPLREYLLQKNVTLDNEEHRPHKMIQRLKKWGCGLFFSGSSKLDDLYMIFAILYHNFDVQLLTDDRFQDHLHDMDKFAVIAFKKWMGLNTIQVVRIEDGRPIFKLGRYVDLAVQQQDNIYHFPLKNGDWLCCLKHGNQNGTRAVAALKGLKSS